MKIKMENKLVKNYLEKYVWIYYTKIGCKEKYINDV